MPRYTHRALLAVRSLALAVLALLIPIAAQAQTQSFSVFESAGINRRDVCLSAKLATDVAMECGDLRITHALPAIRTFDKTRAPVLIYNSQLASPAPVIQVDVTYPGNAPVSVDAWVEKDGVSIGSASFSGSDWTSGSTRRIGIPINVSTLPTYMYYANVFVRANWSGGGSTAGYQTIRLPIVNRSTSPYGAGWWIAGLEELVLGPWSNLMWVGGDGSNRYFTPAASCPGGHCITYVAVDRFDRPDTITYDSTSNTYMRLTAERTKVWFNSEGRHDSTVNRLGHRTKFKYVSATRRLDEIYLPTRDTSWNRNYHFQYDGNNLLWFISIPSNPSVARTTSFVKDGSRITSISDPDTTVVQFSYGTGSNTNRIVSRTDRRNFVTTFTYDGANKLYTSSLNLGGGKTIGYRTIALEGQALTTAQPTGIYIRIDGPRDAGDFAFYWVNRYGAVTGVWNALGQTTNLTYDAMWPGLVSQIVRPNGFTTTATYDASANQTMQVGINPYGDGKNDTTRFEWDAKWTRVTKITRPMGDIVQFAYDQNNGNLLRRQAGTDPARRDSLVYYSDGLLKLHIDALGNRDSLGYESWLGNVQITRSPLGFITLHYATDDGRDTLITTPTDAQQTPSLKTKTYTVYDLMDRVKQVRTVGGSDSLVVNNTYDTEENLTSVSRRSYPDTNHLGWVKDTLVYDGAGRVTQKIGAKTIAMRYDPAGNLVWTSRGDSTVYDALNRPVQHLLPAVTADVSNSGWSMDEPNGAAAETESFAYDATGQLTTADNQYAQIRRGYYPNGALRVDTLKLREYGTTGFSTVVPLEFVYDLNGRRSKLKHQRVTLGTALSDSIMYSYHSQTGALQNVTDPQGSTFAYADDNAGRLQSLTLPDASVDTWTYDNDGRLSARNTIDVGTRDARGLVLARTYSNLASESYQFTYSALGAVKQSLRGVGTSNARQEDFAPDAFGNTAKYELMGVGGDGSYKRVYDAGTGQILTSSRYQQDEPYAGQFKLEATYLYNTLGDQIESRHYTYVLGRDCVGQCVGNEPPTTDSTVQAQTYDANGRLRYVKATTRRHFLTTDSVGIATTEYRYDALGRRVLTRYRGPIACQYSGSSTACRNTLDHSVWDGNQLLSESREVANGSSGSGTTGWDGDVVYTYGRELDVPLAMLRRSTTTSCTFRVFPRTDLLGRLAGGTFPSGTPSCAHVDWPAASMRTYRFLAGSVAAPWNGSLVTLNGDESGLQYMRNRYFDPATGQFTQEDPIGIAGGINLYGFAAGDPINYSDPFGLCKNAKGEEVPPEECDKPLERPLVDPVAIASGFITGFVRGLFVKAALSAAEGSASSEMSASAHGAMRMAQSSRLGIEAANDVVKNATRTFSQKDGAQVFAQEMNGRFNVVVQGERGVVTTFKNLSQKAMDRLAKNYGWEPK